MKKIMITSLTCLSLFSIAFLYSCNKTKEVSKAKKEINLSIKTNEISFFPKDKNEAGKLAIAFLKTTKYCPNNKQLRDGSTCPNLDPMLAAWDFEACSNFLSNSNITKPTGHSLYSIELTKDANGNIVGTDLSTKFNNFQTTLSNQTNFIPKLVNITVVDNGENFMHIQADVSYGQNNVADIVFPNSNMDYIPAVSWLNTNSSSYLMQFVPGLETACDGLGLYYYNISSLTPLCTTFLTMNNDMPDPWLWTAYVANNNPLDPIFKATDFPKYYGNIITRANALNAIYGSTYGKVIDINLSGQQVINGANQWNCNMVDPLIEGYQHALENISMAQIGCLPLPN